MSEHALLSASSSHRWIACPGSVALCKDIPRTSSRYADEGTAAHTMAADILTALDYAHVESEMLTEVKKYTDFVSSLVGDGTLMVEKRVDYSSYIGVADSFGTSDAIIVDASGEEIAVIDLKYGRGVRIDADNNSQLMLYALGSLDELSFIYPDIQRIRLIIHQPRLDHISEWSCSLAELMAFADKVKIAALAATSVAYGEGLTPGEDQCRFCPAKATCPALSAFVQAQINSGFDTIEELAAPVSGGDLSRAMKAIPLIEDWCKAIRAKVEAELFAGKAVDGFKLVEGRKGARNWVNQADAEGLLKSFRLKIEQMYDLSLISPTTAEKLLKDQPRRWAKAEALIVRRDGKPSVAPASDKRPALAVTPPEDGFEAINNDEGD